MDTLRGLAASGISLVPGGSFLKEFVDHAYPDANEDWRLAAASEYQDMVHGLDERVRRLEDILREEGETLYDLGPIRTRRLLLSWAKVIGDADGEAKRAAVNNATARQFDPRWLSADVRKHWFDRVATLSDVELEAVRLLGQFDVVAYAPDEGMLICATDSPPNETESKDSRSVALGSALFDLLNKGVVTKSGRRYQSDGGDTESFAASGYTRALLDAIAEIGEPDAQPSNEEPES